eukprot:10215280-Alexandrium_andersonii.AAC.1
MGEEGRARQPLLDPDGREASAGQPVTPARRSETCASVTENETSPFQGSASDTSGRAWRRWPEGASGLRTSFRL